MWLEDNVLTFATVNGAAIHYSLRRIPGRPTILFINSLGTDFRIWQPVIDRLGDKFGYLLSDKRGHGLSELGSAPQTIETYAEDLVALMDHADLGRVIICGLSIGGLIAHALFASRPDLIQRLIFCDTASKIGTADMWNGRIAAANGPGIASFSEGVMEKWFTPDFHRNRAAELVGYKSMLDRQSPAGYAAACAAIRDADFSAIAKKIDVPALVVVGDQDGSTPPALVEGLARSIAGARFEVIAGAAHIPCVEQPEVLARLIREFAADATSETAT